MPHSRAPTSTGIGVPRAGRNEGLQAPRRTLDAYFSNGATLAFGRKGNRHWTEVTLAPDAVMVRRM